MANQPGMKSTNLRLQQHQDVLANNVTETIKSEKQNQHKERSADSSTVLLERVEQLEKRVSVRHAVVTAAVVVVVLICAATLVTLLYNIPPSAPSLPEDILVLVAPDPSTPPPPTPSVLGQFKKAAVVSNGGPCAVFGKQMLEKGGSAVDAAIATMICDGAACLHNMGLGGGFLMTIYDRRTRTVKTLNARETAPAAASQDMFHGNTTLSTVGGLSIAVPGELRGYQAAWELYGKLEWHELFEPTIKLCQDGVPVNQHLARNLQVKEPEIRRSPTLSKLLLKKDGKLPQYEELIKMPQLAMTLKRVAFGKGKAEELYNGSLTDAFIADIQSAGGILTAQDLDDYKPVWKDPVVAPLSGNLTLYSSPPPGSGYLLAFILRVLDGFVTEALTEVQVTQRITEAFKHAYGRRTDLADPDFYDISQVVQDLTSQAYVEEVRSRIHDSSTSQRPADYGAHYAVSDDHGTANIVVLAPDGSAVAATSTVNLLFGSQFASLSTGILLNDEMDDFSAPSLTNYFGLPPSTANYIAPGKRPMSSMCPTLVVDGEGEVRLAIGSAGGTKITTSTALVTVWNLWFGKNIKEAIDHPRFHHQLIPMEFAYEYGLVKEVVDGVKKAGHVTRRMPIDWRSCVTAIARNKTSIYSNSDNRRPGRSSGF